MSEDRVMQLGAALQQHIVEPLRRRFQLCERNLNGLDARLGVVERQQRRVLLLLGLVAVLLTLVLGLLLAQS